MRAGLTVVVLLVAAGVIGWFLWGESSSVPTDGGRPDGPPDGPGPEERAPALIGSGEGRPHVPDEIRGRGAIQGTVRRKNEPAAATVELRHVAQFDPANPFKGGVVGMMIERMLDSGISSTEVIARTQAGEDGTYRFGRLSPGIYEVRATAASGAQGLASAILPARGARVEADVDLPAGDGRLEGRVVFADGKPFRGLVVAFSDQGFAALMGGGRGMQPARTDEDGRFVLAGLSPGSTRVSAMVPGVMRLVTAPITIPYAGEYLLTIDADGVQATGQVVSAATGEAIAGASVFGGGGDGENTFSIRSTTSDAEGRFELLVPAGRGGLLVRAEGYAPQEVQFRGGSKKDQVVTLQALGTIRGRVLEKAPGGGAPVSGVLVLAMPEGRRGMNVPSGTTTDADGAYVLDDVPPGTVALRALGAGWISLGAGNSGRDGYNPYIVEVEPGGSQELDLEVTPAARATGRVVDADGTPVQGAVIQPGSGGDGLGGMITMLLGLGGTVGSAVTDREGVYLLDTLVPDQTYTLSAKAPEHPDAKSKPFKAVSGETHEVDLVFEASRWLELRVVDAVGGTPVAGANVLLRAKEGSGIVEFSPFFGGGTSRTDGDGRVRLGPLPRGELVLVIEAAGYVARKKVPVEGAATKDVEQTVELTRGLIIAGRVVLPEGVPVSGVRVTIQLDRAPSEARGWFYGRALLGPDGTFRLATLEHAGSYEVKGRAEWEGKRYQAEMTVEAGDEDVVLELKAGEVSGEALKVRVLGSDGKPVPSARIKLYRFQKGSSGTTQQQVSNGTASFDSVDVDAELWIEVWDAVGGDHGAHLSGPYTATKGELEIRLPAGLTIAGTIVGPDGKGVRGVQVKAHAPHPAKQDRWAENHDTAFTDDEGRFLLDELGDFEYRLAFKGPPDCAPAEDQMIRAGEKNVRVTMRAGLTALLTVLDYDGKPVVDASVNLSAARLEGKHSPSTHSHDQHVSTDATGVARLRRLESDGTYDVDIRPPDERNDLNRRRLKGWSPTDETIRLARAYTIAGTVSDLQGKPMADCWVQYRPLGEKHWTGSRRTGEDGRFVVKQLAQGRYELRAGVRGAMRTHGPGSAPSEPNIRVARAGDQKVDLVLDVGETLVVRVEGLAAGSSGWHMATLTAQSDALTIARSRLGRDGRVRFTGLRANTSYIFSIGGLPGGRYAQARDLRPGGDEVVVRAQQGVSLRGRVVLPAGVTFEHLGVQASNEQQMGASTTVDLKTGTFELEGLPEGAWTVQCWGNSDKQWYSGQAKGNTGSEVVLELKKQEPGVR